MRQFCEILLDGASILPVVKALRLERRSDQAVDALTLELADYSLYGEFDFGTLSAAPRVHVATAAGDPKSDGSTSGNTLGSASSNFLAEGVTEDDLLFVLESDEPADIGAWPITAVMTSQIQSSHNFATETGVVFIVLTSQGRFFIEKPDVAEDKHSVTIPSLWGRSALARLIDPFAPKISRTWKAATSFYQVCRELVGEAGMDENKIVFDIDDYPIPPDVLSVAGQYPLQIISELAAKTNGYVRNTKAGQLWVKRELFHFDALPLAQALGDLEVADSRTRIEFPEFGNRILVRSVVGSSSQPIRVRIISPESCLRGDGKSSMIVEAVVVDGEGRAVGDGTLVDWTISDPSLAAFEPVASGTGTKVIISEAQRAAGLFSLSVDYPIRKVVGVFLESDVDKNENFFDGGDFDKQQINLIKELPFSDSRLVVDYVATGVAVSRLRTIALAIDEQQTEIHAAVGKMRSSTAFCINNKRNVSVSLSADRTGFNLCEETQGLRQSKLTAAVSIDGAPGAGAMVEWRVAGAGTVAPKFSAVTNALIEDEAARAVEIYEVATKHKIFDVVGVWLKDSGKTGLNYFKTGSRKGRFEDNVITLAANLPHERSHVIIDYKAQGIATAVFTAPGTVGTSAVIARLSDGTSTKIEADVEIETTYQCSEPGEGSTPDAPPGGETDCEASVSVAAACSAGNYPNAINATVEECICRQETAGDPCPEGAEGCRAFCEQMYAKYGLDPLSCERRVTDAERRKLELDLGRTIFSPQAKAVKDCAAECADNQTDECMEPCEQAHRGSTVDRCQQKCEDHGVIISPLVGSINCSGAKEISFSVKGGKGPYHWSASVGVLEVGEGDGQSATLKAPANQGAGVPGNAYRLLKGHRCGSGFNQVHSQWFSCDDVASACGSNFANEFTYNPSNCSACGDSGSLCAPEHTAAMAFVNHTPCENPPTPNNCCSFPGFTCDADGTLCDARTPSMIAAGCNPCRLALEQGGTVTVTDSRGMSATAVVTA